ncbi:hypothetical protein [uncultured Desulfuromonas sp.]|uniref:hypothetical protein n=1 Tax=uncultured Desulfuromonas sp. TaxID=181013 RepID=UPI00262EB7E6|nr:hypothetical protein [uncultured Desulfuromonas sp.]
MNENEFPHGGRPGGSGPGEGVRCPQCGGDQFHLLGDGRIQCRQCRKRITVDSKTTRLDGVARGGIVDLFWRFVPADRGAELLGLNRKTVQGHYNRIREEIERQNRRDWPLTEREGAGPDPGTDGTQVLLWLFTKEAKVHLRFSPAEGEGGCLGPSSVVDAPNRTARERLAIETFRHRAWHPGASAEEVRLGMHFWAFAKSRLTRYRGGFRRKFPLFMAEMEYRFNYREHPEIPGNLKDLWSRLGPR